MGKNMIRVGLLGMGTVGSGVFEILKMNEEQVRSRAGAGIEVKKVLVRDLEKERPVKIDRKLLTTDPEEVLKDPEIDVIVEVIGGTGVSRQYVEEALRNKKFVITANKDLMATAGAELLLLARKHNRNIYYEASVGGGIPLIRPLKHSLGANKIIRLMGIVNGTTNYILTKMSMENMDFETALAEAQDKGFAEQDPSNDLEGKDAAYKLCILAGLAFSSHVRFADVYTQGINNISKRDIFYARELGFAIKLLAIGEENEKGLALKVHPTLIPLSHPLAAVHYENNALFVVGNAVGETMFYGLGAGALPTGSSVVADLIDVARNINHQVENGIMETEFKTKKIVPTEELFSAFYLRLQAVDKPGAFANLATAFGDEHVSLDMILQKRSVEGLAEIVLVTHAVEEKRFAQALKTIKGFPAIKKINSVLRVFEK
ncbi:MAG: homoserine dehydrogenase [Firmicutes bacterium]|nr:homoserine dehydrogenase [Bacillota bacterium]